MKVSKLNVGQYVLYYFINAILMLPPPKYEAYPEVFMGSPSQFGSKPVT